MRIAIVGAGMTGLSCARMLADAGLEPIVFEKSRGLGGRLATRRTDALRFDHGAQFVTARGESFRKYLEQNAQPWQPEGAPEGWFAGAPSMNDLVRPLAEGLDVWFDELVAPVRDRVQWHIGEGLFDRVVSTVPVTQARNMFSGMMDPLTEVEIAPCWTLMAAFVEPTDWPDMWRAREGDLAWIGRNSAKPGRVETPESWVVHASPEWSRDHLEIDKEAAPELMLNLLREARGSLPDIVYASAHRWRYAMTTTALGRSHVASEDGSLLIGGDWCLGARVEDAWESGRAMAAAILNP